MENYRIEFCSENPSQIDIIADDVTNFLRSKEIKISGSASKGMRGGDLLSIALSIIGGAGSLIAIIQGIRDILKKEDSHENKVEIYIVHISTGHRDKIDHARMTEIEENSKANNKIDDH